MLPCSLLRILPRCALFLALTFLLPTRSTFAHSLEEPAVGIWNTFHSQTNFAEILNLSDIPTSLVATVYDSAGTALGSQAFTVAAKGTMHLDLHSLAGTADAYGTYTIAAAPGVDGSSIEIAGLTTFYKQSAAGSGTAIDYGFTIPLLKDMTGSQSGLYNSINPSPAGTTPVQNWLSVQNTSNAPFSASVEVYHQDGSLDIENSYEITNLAPNARTDLALGHHDGEVVGLYRIIPSDSAQTYNAVLIRYGLNSLGQHKFAFPLHARAGACNPGRATASTMHGASNWAVLANVSDDTIDAIVDVSDQTGSLVYSETHTLAPRSQEHIFINSILGEANIGQFRVRCASGSSADKLIAQSLFYGSTTNPAIIDWAYASQARAELATSAHALVAPYNTHLGSPNWLKLIDSSASATAVQVTAYQADGSLAGITPATIPASGTFDYNIGSLSGFDAVGLITLTSEATSAQYSAELVRVFPHSSGVAGYIMAVDPIMVEIDDIGEVPSGDSGGGGAPGATLSCGDGVCAAGENETSCPTDCGPSTCDSITIVRDRNRPVGKCYANGSTSCTAQSQCTSHAYDYCVHGISASDSSQACYDNDSPTCLQDITFTFAQSYQCGRFADGSWWVAAGSDGQVTITSVSPAHTTGCETGSGTCLNSWVVNHSPTTNGIDNRVQAPPFTALAPSLPYTATLASGEIRSILKVVSNRIGWYSITTSSRTRPNRFLSGDVLTLVANNRIPSAGSFRPGWVGPTKFPLKSDGSYYNVSDLRLDRLPRIPSQQPGGSDFASWFNINAISRFFRTPYLGQDGSNSSGFDGFMTLDQSYVTYTGSASAVNGYHSARAIRIFDAMARLTIDDLDFTNNPLHQTTLYRGVQTGLDLAAITKNWVHGMPYRYRVKGTAMPIAFSAFLLGAPNVADTNFPSFSEVDTFSRNRENVAVYGYYADQNTYWNYLNNGVGNKRSADPYGWIDPPSVYQSCCSSATWKPGAFVMLHMQALDPAGFAQITDVLPIDTYLEYQRRWVDFGYYTAPDPCAPPDPRDEGCDPRYGECQHYGHNCPSGDCTWGPAAGNDPNCHASKRCSCITGSGRRTSMHGTSADGGSWRSGYGDALWDEHL